MNQLSGKIARTPEGKVINDLMPRKVRITANSDTGQRGKWENNK